MKKFSFWALAALLMFAVAGLSACGDDPMTPGDEFEPESIVVADVQLNQPTLSMVIGTTETLTATVYPKNVENKNLDWSSAEPAIARVDDSGVVTAVAAGETTVTVTTEEGGHTATCTVSVVKEAIPVESIALRKAKLDLVVGDVSTLEVVVTPTNATNVHVAWTNSHDDVAKVEEGKVTALKAGTTAVTATTEGKSASAVVNVAAIQPDAKVMDSGQTGDLSWKMWDNGLLEITGDDGMPSYSASQAAPWARYAHLIKKVTVGEGVQSIGEAAFAGCTVLTEVTLPEESLEWIDYAAFAWCVNLSKMDLPQTLEWIYDWAFQHCEAWTGPVSLTEEIEYIGIGAFAGCRSLAAIEVAAGNENYASENGVLFTKNMTDLICYPAGKPDTSYTIPEDVSVWEGAFRGCRYLTDITLSGLATDYITEGTFYGCTALTGVTIPEGVEGIYSEAFHGCTSLASVTLPSTLSYISWSVFNHCPALTDVNCLAVSPPGMDSGNFTAKGDALTVPEGSELNYLLSWTWQQLFTTMPALAPYTPSDAAITSVDVRLFDGDEALALPNAEELLCYYYEHYEQCLFLRYKPTFSPTSDGWCVYFTEYDFTGWSDSQLLAMIDYYGDGITSVYSSYTDLPGLPKKGAGTVYCYAVAYDADDKPGPVSRLSFEVKAANLSPVDQLGDTGYADPLTRSSLSSALRSMQNPAAPRLMQKPAAPVAPVKPASVQQARGTRPALPVPAVLR